MITIKTRLSWLPLALMTLVGTASAAAAGDRVMSLDVVQAAAPFSVMRGKDSVPPARVVPLASGDQLRTGINGRGSLRFGVTMMTLGPDAALKVGSIQQPAGGLNGRVDLDLGEGAFRVDGTEEHRLPQDVRLTMLDLRLRIFGADVWASAGATRREVCLLSGAVEIVGVSGSERLDVPGDCLSSDASGLHRQKADDASMKQRLALTDYASLKAAAAAAAIAAAPRQEPAKIAPVTAATASGWTLVAAALADSESAEAEAQGMVEMGLPGVVRIHDLPDGQRVYRVTIGSFATKEQAVQFGAEVKKRFGMTQIWAAPY
ncbi:MAG: Sporulation related protein [Hydrocarboniphaga sp.]|uniref:SPOR domain-containing protein n=1 Tax=Hydrocarboniphaga sp. TaxID=2033016 RepID=UPI00260B88DA|nr:SPOR domain-containing protein [Hydrocarboniphaga sp.]MDB5972940.1 Sporulation related protein [Hydrocarboniphaga sp.]